MKIVTDAMVRSVSVDGTGRAKAVTFIDRTTRKPINVQANTVVLAASACETARILLNSRTNQLPNGVANSSGQVGRNLMDSTGANVSGHVPALEGRPRYNEDGHTSNHIFIPWWGHEAQAKGQLDFPRGYHFELGGGFRPPSMGVRGSDSGYGVALKERIHRAYGAGVGLALRGEMLPNANCFMEIDDQVQDQWGIPVVKFHWRWSEHELNQVAHGLRTAGEIIKTMGGTVNNPQQTPEEAIKKGGEIIHEVGTTRMGNNANDSVTNEWGQTWDVPNLFIMDGGVFASNPHKNCTLTLMTLAMRNADRLSNKLNKGTL